MLHQQIDLETAEREAWALRRQRGIPHNRRLWVLACMDERLPVEEALGIRMGDAHVFRNAGGLVTDDAIRSAMLTTQFFGTKEIIVVNHTECGMMSATGDFLTDALKDRGIDIETVQVDPALPELELPAGVFSKWLKTFSDVDDTCGRQVELLRNCPLIPEDVVIHGYVWEVESMRLRHPHSRLADRVNTAKAMAAKGQCYGGAEQGSCDMYTMSVGPFATQELKLKLRALRKLVESGMLPHRSALTKMHQIVNVEEVIAK